MHEGTTYLPSTAPAASLSISLYTNSPDSRAVLLFSKLIKSDRWYSVFCIKIFFLTKGVNDFANRKMKLQTAKWNCKPQNEIAKLKTISQS